MIYHIVQEVTTTVAVLTVFTTIVVFYLIRKSRSGKTKISVEAQNERIFAFNPKPLIDEHYLKGIEKETLEICQPNETDEGCLNLAKINYLNLLKNEEIKNTAIQAIHKYGVGSCGPRGFYGTIDVHLDLEDELANFMEMEECVLYSYGFSTIASAIGAYCKKSDIIFTDEMISFTAQQGFLAGKSTIEYFKHNDLAQLEAKLIEYEQKEQKRNKMYRKFLVVEGIYGKTGTICPLPQLMELRKKYNLRLFIDESISFGVLGKTGRGITEHFDVDRNDVDMIMGSLEGSIGSIGGFCVGASVIIEHQRLSGLGYCFSASLPPCLSEIAISAIKIFRNDPNLFKTLSEKCKQMNQKLKSIKNVDVLSDPISPVQVLVLKNGNLDKTLQYCTSNNLHLVKQENALLLNICVDMDTKVMDKVVSILQGATA